MDTELIELIERLNNLAKEYIRTDKKLNIAVQALVEIDPDKAKEVLQKIMEVK